MIVSKASPEAIDRAAALLRQGGVVILPGDTIYGLTARVPDGEPRLRSLKGRGEDKPFLMLIHDPAWMEPFTDQPLPAALAAYWPGPLTLLFKRRAGAGAAAFRLPADPFLRAVLELVGAPLFSTSVNRAGGPFLRRLEEIRAEFEPAVDLIVSAGDLPAAEPSTILDVSARPYRVVRQGSLVLPASLFTE